MNFSVAHAPTTIVLSKQKKHRSLLLELPIRISHHASLRYSTLIFEDICFYLKVWACVCKSIAGLGLSLHVLDVFAAPSLYLQVCVVFAGLGLYLQVWGVFVALGLCLHV